MTHVIRQATLTDQSAIEACVQSAYATYVDRIGKKPAPMLADYQALIGQNDVFVLTVQESIRGVLVMMRQDESMFVENIAVDPRFQGQGFGHMLMAFAESKAREQRLGAIRLYTNELMTENQIFYRKLGFVEEDHFMQDGYRRVSLRRLL